MLAHDMQHSDQQQGSENTQGYSLEVLQLLDAMTKR